MNSLRVILFLYIIQKRGGVLDVFEVGERLEEHPGASMDGGRVRARVIGLHGCCKVDGRDSIQYVQGRREEGEVTQFGKPMGFLC